MNANITEIARRDDAEPEPQKTIHPSKEPVHKGHPEINIIHNVDLKIASLTIDTGVHLKLKAQYKIWIFLLSSVLYAFLSVAFIAFSAGVGYLALRFLFRLPMP